MIFANINYSILCLRISFGGRTDGFSFAFSLNDLLEERTQAVLLQLLLPQNWQTSLRSPRKQIFLWQANFSRPGLFVANCFTMFTFIKDFLRQFSGPFIAPGKVETHKRTCTKEFVTLYGDDGGKRSSGCSAFYGPQLRLYRCLMYCFFIALFKHTTELEKLAHTTLAQGPVCLDLCRNERTPVVGQCSYFL